MKRDQDRLRNPYASGLAPGTDDERRAAVQYLLTGVLAAGMVAGGGPTGAGAVDGRSPDASSSTPDDSSATAEGDGAGPAVTSDGPEAGRVRGSGREDPGDSSTVRPVANGIDGVGGPGIAASGEGGS